MSKRQGRSYTPDTPDVIKKRRREYTPDPSPPYKLKREMDIVVEVIAQTIADNPSLPDYEATALANDFIFEAKRARTPEQAHAIASSYLLDPQEVLARKGISFASPVSSSSSSSSYLPPDDSDLIQSEEESGQESDDDSFFSDSPTAENYPTTFQKAHGTGVTRDTLSSSMVKKMFVGNDLCYLDLHNTGQDYGPGVYQGQILSSFISSIQEGYAASRRQGNSVNMFRFTMHLQIILPDRTVTELSSGLLNDELRLIIVKDSQPNPSPPSVTDVLSVHDSHHTINAFINPATAERFTILYDTSFFMQYTTLWEFTRGGAEKEATVLPCDIKEVIDIDLMGERCSFDRTQTNYQSLIDYNIFAMFITARGIKLTHAIFGEAKEAETFKIDWSARIVFQ